MSRKLTIDEIRKRCYDIHSDKYIIPDQDYVDSFTKIKIICKEHGEFYMESRHLLSGHGCKKCVGCEKLTIDDVRKRCYETHGDNIMIPDQEYINAKTKIKIICKYHLNNNLLTTTNNLLNHKRGCPICSKRQKLNIDEIRKRCDIIHRDKGYIIPNQIYINNCTHINIICPVHEEWSTQPNNLLNGCGCPKCKTSKSEIKIENILKENNINYICQKKFSDCINKKELPFDFYLPNHNMCIEYDGEQHFKQFRFEKNDEKLQKRIKNDIIKNEYCKNNNIKLLRIRFDDSIDKKMKKIFNI